MHGWWLLWSWHVDYALCSEERRRRRRRHQRKEKLLPSVLFASRQGIHRWLARRMDAFERSYAKLVMPHSRIVKVVVQLVKRDKDCRGLRCSSMAFELRIPELWKSACSCMSIVAVKRDTVQQPAADLCCANGRLVWLLCFTTQILKWPAIVCNPAGGNIISKMTTCVKHMQTFKFMFSLRFVKYTVDVLWFTFVTYANNKGESGLV